MNEKIKIFILVLIFVIMLIGIKILINYQTKISVQNVSKTSNVIQNDQTMEEENLMENNVLDVTEENFEGEVIKETKTVLIDFYADWCGPCQVLSPIVDDFAKANKDIKVVRINVDNAEDLAIRYGIMSIPTLVVMKNGKEVNRSIGLISQSQVEQLVK